jgi:hypothetical protein
MNQRQALKAFYNNQPVTGDFEIEKNVTCFFLDHPKSINFGGRGDTYLWGDYKGSLDLKSKKIVSKWKTKLKDKFWSTERIPIKFKADILIISPFSKTFRKQLTDGFYHYNPHFTMRDSVLAFKLKKK